VLYGEQGSAKTTTAKGLRYLLDPHTTPLRSPPHQTRDLAVAAKSSWVIAYDNVSDVRPWLSDVLCQLATGAGFGTRKLYTDDEEALITASRPILLNGIAAEMVNRPDLLDRALVIELPAIPDEARRTEEAVWQDLEAKRPLVLGALLDVVVAGLRNLSEVKLECLPRMADFARWVEACAPALGWQPEEFTQTCLQVRVELDEQVLSLWAVAPVLDRLLAKNKGGIETTVGKLLMMLNEARGKEEGFVQDWPRTAKALGSELRLFTPSLRRTGIEVTFLGRARKGYRVRISRVPVPSPVAQEGCTS
jgi:hypothetical protein